MSTLDQAIGLDVPSEAERLGYKVRHPDNDVLQYKVEPSHDPVNQPSHYNQGGIEAIDGIEASMTELEFRGYLKGNAMKYLWRYRYKGKAWEDLKKASWYLDKLINHIEKYGDEA